MKQKTEQAVDVLALLSQFANESAQYGDQGDADRFSKARAAVAELVDCAEEAILECARLRLNSDSCIPCDTENRLVAAIAACRGDQP